MIFVAFLMAAADGNGPISKFDRRVPDVELRSEKSSGEIERCLIDLPGLQAPHVFRQPDRPNEVTIVWVIDGQFSSASAARADLKSDGAGTLVRMWMKGSAARACL